MGSDRYHWYTNEEEMRIMAGLGGYGEWAIGHGYRLTSITAWLQRYIVTLLQF